MATIPIEVIVQDAETPVGPTPVDPTDSGDNTNITVPDTGAGVVDSNNSGINNSSAAISIVSIVIAVLAIGAVITLLVRRYNKRKKANIEAGNNTRQERKAMAATSTIAVLALTVLLGQLVVAGAVSPIATNAATDDTVSDEAELDVDSKITIIATRTAEDEDTVVATVKNTSTATSYQTFGYKVTASMADNATTANLYLDGDETSEYYIAPVSNEGNGTLETNTWGYTLAETSEDYLPIPLATDPTTIVKGYNNIDDEPVDIYYTIQVDKDLPAGTYTGTLEYTLTDNNFPSTLTTMQGMTTEICEDTFTPGNQTTDPVPTATLTDIRDNKTYTIAKLADGNCWMIQNLDHDIVSTPDFYTSANTDLPSGITWTGAATKVTGDTSWANLTTAPESYDPGSLYWNGAIIYDQVTCEEYGGTWQPWGSCDDAKTTSSAGDDYYYLGNYYNWTAAVAMSDSSAYTTDQQDVNQSICPAGWRLPTYSGGKSYQNLVGTLSITSGVDGNIQNSPVYFVYGGNWHGRFGGMSGSGSYWLSVPYDSGASYVLGFNSSGSLPSQGLNGRSTGYLVRCVAR